MRSRKILPFSAFPPAGRAGFSAVRSPPFSFFHINENHFYYRSPPTTLFARDTKIDPDSDFYPKFSTDPSEFFHNGSSFHPTTIVTQISTLVNHFF
jgi:hypothetical protein